MSASRFVHFELRTTNPEAARDFYERIVGPAIWRPGSGCSLALLPEQAAARGAPAHWLGHLGVDDVEASAARLVTAGAQRLGPPATISSPAARVILRDPFGAIVALVARPSDDVRHAEPAVVWHQLNARDHEPAFAGYAHEFGWLRRELIEPGSDGNILQSFAWEDDAPAIGSVANTARLAHVHTAWLFFFRCARLDETAALVRAAGGITVGPLEFHGGTRVLICDDPQGGAFALLGAAE